MVNYSFNNLLLEIDVFALILKSPFKINAKYLKLLLK